MKKILIGIGLLLVSYSVFAKNFDNKVNKLIRLEAADGQYAAQVVFEFVRPLYFEKTVIIPGEQVELVFPGLDLSDFIRYEVEKKFMALKGIVRNIVVRYEKIPVPRVVLLVTFIKDKVLLRLTKMEDPNLLVLDIFNKEVLESLRKKGTTTLYACNDRMPGGLTAFPVGLTLAKKKRKFFAKRTRIVIDPGHGGRDGGTVAFGLKEKNITLDIARKIYTFLKKEGFKVFLTRSSDTSLRLIDRIQLSRQLKADLFIAIHVNAFHGLENVSGLETHFLDGSPFFGEKKRKSFMFVSSNIDKELTNVADGFLLDKIDCSKTLSEYIQEGVLGYLNNRNIAIEDRGVKRTTYRTLLRSEVPSSIVEVGFVTNKKEAKLFTKPWYRQFLAQGICNGIKKFLAS